jgi:hypothetical protein
MSATGSQFVVTVLVAPSTVNAFCAPPRSAADRHTRRAPAPWYQPSR